MNGDRHNFGRFVNKVLSKTSIVFYQKPRCVFWEYFFFGVDSPLKEILEEYCPFFRLNILSENSYLTGASQEILSGEEAFFSNSHWRSTGALTAYCTIFGIQDLHRNNGIWTDGRIQPIDVESVFLDSPSTDHIGILPSPIYSLNQSWIPQIQSMSGAKLFEQFVKGFDDTWEGIRRTRNQLVSICAEQYLHNYPIRIMVRSSKEYSGRQRITFPLFFEEEVQIDRGEIPYFYTTLNSSTLFYYSAPSQVSAVSDLPKWVSKKIENICHPTILLRSSRLNEVSKASILTYALNRLVPADVTLNYRSTQFAVVVENNNISVECGPTRIQARRNNSYQL